MSNYTEYQKRTISRILDNYYPINEKKPVKRMLVSDEVGLGKTYVAKGLIRAMAYKYMCNHREEDDIEFRVLYLCSNLNIAKQNEKKLSLQELEHEEKTEAEHIEAENTEEENTDAKKGKKRRNRAPVASENRSSMLYLHVLRTKLQSIPGQRMFEEYQRATGRMDETICDGIEKKNIGVRVLPVTPATSINLESDGWIQEREYIIRMLDACNQISFDDYTSEECVIASKSASPEQKRYAYEALFERQDEDFKNKVATFNEKLVKYKDKNPDFKQVITKIKKKENITKTDWSILRKAFSVVTLDVFSYHCVILDEFQNFHDILWQAEEAAKKKHYVKTRRQFIKEVLNHLEIDNKLSRAYKNMEGISNLSSAKQIEEILRCSNIKDRKDFIQKLTNLDKKEKEINLEEETGFVIEKQIFSDEFEMNRSACHKRDLTHGDVELIQVATTIYCDRSLPILEEIIGETPFDLNAFLNEKYSKIEKNGISQVYVGGFEYHFKMVLSSYNKRSMECIYKWIRSMNEKVLYGTRWSAHPYLEIKNWLESEECKLSDDEKRILAFNVYCYHIDSDANKHDDKEVAGRITKLWQYVTAVERWCEIRQVDKVNEKDYVKILLLSLFPAQKSDVQYASNATQIILEKIFDGEEDGDTRILLLSATPFKMYLGKNEFVDSVEASKETIAEVCNFLSGDNQLSNSLQQYKNQLISFSKSNESTLPEALRVAKTEFLENMERYFSRMERNAVLRELQKCYEGSNCLESENTKVNTDLEIDRISSEEQISYDYAPLIQYINELQNLMKTQNRKKMENYCMRLPYALSFMIGSNNKENSGQKNTDRQTGYELKRNFEKILTNDRLEEVEDEIKYALIPKTSINTNESLGMFHGVYKAVCSQVLDGAETLLWIPPVTRMNTYGKENQNSNPYGKTIIFSAWTPVPRMLSVLLSMESVKRIKEFIAKSYGNDLFQKELPVLREIHAALKKKERIELDYVSNCVNKAISSYFGVDCGQDTIIEQEIGSHFVKKIFLLSDVPETGEGNYDLYLNGLLILYYLYRMETKEISLETVKVWIARYCDEYYLQETLEEYFYMNFSTQKDASSNNACSLLLDAFGGGESGNQKQQAFIKSSKIKVTVVDDSKKVSDITVYTNFARGLGSSTDDDKVNAIENLQKAFNSPFRPFVFSTTSMGQEGLDFHYYADKIVHWNLPSNPVDFEQREGRINRRDCLAIRKYVVEKYADEIKEKSVKEILDEAFKKAEADILPQGKIRSEIAKCGMIPHWLMPIKENNKIQGAVSIRRIVPYFGGSKVFESYNQNLKVLQLYRTVIGQPDPDELLERLMSKEHPENLMKELYLDFSPYAGVGDS